MKYIGARIEGLTPLLMNRFTEEAQASATSGNRLSTVGGAKGTPREQAERKVYRSGDGNGVIIPDTNLLRCVVDAGKYFKAGKSKVTTQKSSLVPACVAILPREVPLEHDGEWTVDSRPVRIPSTGGRILAHRPCFPQWALAFEIELDDEVISARLLRDILEVAGKRVGLGDFRPDCKGSFGKFSVNRWEVRAEAPQ